MAARGVAPGAERPTFQTAPLGQGLLRPTEHLAGQGQAAKRRRFPEPDPRCHQCDSTAAHPPVLCTWVATGNNTVSSAELGR